MATIKDVASRAGVAVSTVSKYINGGHVRKDNADAIRDAISQLDYRANPFARHLKNPGGRSIGVLLPDMTAPFYGSVVSALDKAVREAGFHTLISCYSSDHGLERDNLQYLMSHGIEGLIYAPENLSAEEFYELTANYNVPVVQIDRIIQGVQSDAVVVDNADAVYHATSCLIEKGHKRVAIITGPQSVFSAKERHVGYLRALSDNGILYDDTMVYFGQNDFATGYRGFEALLRQEDPPTAIVTTNYDITLGLVTAVRERGLHIPEDMDIFGFDCVKVCTMMKPPLPVVHQPETEIGQTAAAYLIERLGGFDGQPRITRLKCSYVPK